MTVDELIDGVLAREGGYQERASDPGNANGGSTNFGITAKSWGIYRGFGRQATRAEVKAITRLQAAEFYRRQYIDNSPFSVVAYDPLRAQLVDFSINSGQERAIRWLQRVLQVPTTGRVDDRTKTAVNLYPGFLVNNALVAARAFMVDKWADADKARKPEEEGVESRALSFFVGAEDVT